MSSRQSREMKKYLKADPDCDPRKEINVLLLGETGVGKSTFINAFANYIVNDTLHEATKDEMQVIIPSSFAHTDIETFEDKVIKIGQQDKFEKYSIKGQSSTQLCRSFIFPIGNRSLRFIDTPGICDTQGIQKDAENFQGIINFIAQYEYLTSVCVLLKAKQERMTIAFQFALNELLRHLHIDTKKNLTFIFTNSRQTFFMPGDTKQILDGFLEKHRVENNVDIPFSRKNSFLFDNEPFRCLALFKNGIQLSEEEKRSYEHSWNKSVTEFARFIGNIVGCPLHKIQKTLSINEAEQLIRKLPRPIAETAKSIGENIQLAREHKRKVLENPERESEGIPQNYPVVKSLDNPLTVCCTKNGCPKRNTIHNKTAEGLSICHDNCFLDGVQQETLSDPRLEDCEVMEVRTGICETCGCHWSKHKHITYDLQAARTHIRLNTRRSNNLNDIDRYRQDLEEENRKIQDVYRQLVQFLHANSLLSINDAYVDYLQYFIEEAKNGRSSSKSREEIANLEKIRDDYLKEMERFKNALRDNKNTASKKRTLEVQNVFELVEELYNLPINGKQIREQVEEIRIKRDLTNRKNEIFVEVPIKAESSTIMLQLQDAVSK